MNTEFERKTVWHEIAPFDCSQIQGVIPAGCTDGMVRSVLYHPMPPVNRPAVDPVPPDNGTQTEARQA